MAVVFESQPPFYSMYVCILSEQSEESIHTDNTYLNLIFQTSIQSIMLEDMSTRQLAEAIQEDLSKVSLIITYAPRRDVAPLMYTSCADLEGKHSCKTPLATLISNIDEASDLIIEKTYK